VILKGNGVTRIFDVGNIYSQASSYTAVVFVDNVLQLSGYSYNNSTQQITFDVAPFANTQIRVVAGRIIIRNTNARAAQPLNRIQVLPGSGTLFNDLGIAVFAYQQTIYSPLPQDYAYFGKTIFISDNTTSLVVGAPRGSMVRPVIFENNRTTFDAGSTDFADTFTNSGAVYLFDQLPAANPSVTNPAKWVFGQQIISTTVQSQDEFGSGIDLTTGVLLVGAPGNDLGSSTDENYGFVTQLINADQTPAWKTIRFEQDQVDVSMLNTAFMYDRVTGGNRQYFDFINPLQGKLLGVVQQNLDYIGAIDSAAYNNGPVNNYGQQWGQKHVGELWFDTANVRFLDPNQNDIVYASSAWGQVFPGSSVDVYQWVSSSTPPEFYAGPGTVRSNDSYSVQTQVNLQGFVEQLYFFWVKDVNTVAKESGKTLSAETIAQYIQNPKNSGIPYLAALTPSALAIFNGREFISAQDTVLHMEFDQTKNDAPVYAEYQLVADRAAGFLDETLYQKFIDSFSGISSTGAQVPDRTLSPSEQYGIAVRPRQSMFVNRFLALQNYLTQANQVLAQFPVTESRRAPLLYSREQEPSANSGAWNLRLANIEELSYQNLNEVSVGYRYLVASDSTNQGRWTIYQVAEAALGRKRLTLIRVQNFDTTLYWNSKDWYQPGFNPLARLFAEVPVYSALVTLLAPPNSVVKVSANAQGQWEIYQLTDQTWVRVALQNGTIEFSELLWNYQKGRYGYDVEVFDSQQFDQEPVVETRQIIRALNEELFVDDLLSERNRLLILMFNYILSEQVAPDWLSKTSLIDVDHVIRELIPFQTYRRDNQDFVLDYINEVKPYHTQIREFNLIYQGQDAWNGMTSDFDVPAYWETDQQKFISPVLDNTGTLSTTSSTPSTDPIWQTSPWDQWFSNYLLSIDSVTVVESGIGYTIEPVVQVTGNSIEPAVMRARINSAGQVISVEVVNPGRGYSTTAIIELIGGNGSGAHAVSVMSNSLVRSLTTNIKYDRYQYTSSIVDWQANAIYANGSLVRFADRVWRAANSNPASSTVTGGVFDTNNWTLVPAAELSGIDRTRGYYVPAADQPGLDLSMLINGIAYPGVQVAALSFDFNPGFDSGSSINQQFNPANSIDPLYIEGVRNVGWSTQAPQRSESPSRVFTPAEWCADRFVGGLGFDTIPFDNIEYGPEGLPTYNPDLLDAIYESSFTDTFLGTRPTDINVDGGQFVDTYESHAPEELLPGIVYDTLDLRVFTTPGGNWLGRGHGWPSSITKFVVTSGASVISFDGLVELPVTVYVSNQTEKQSLIAGVDYTVNWANLTVTLTSSAAAINDVVQVTAYGLGGGNQLYSQAYAGNTVANGVVIPIEFSTINTIAMFVNGVPTAGPTFAAATSSTTRVTFVGSYTAADRIVILALGSMPDGSVPSWSFPLTQNRPGTGSTLINSLYPLLGTNPINLVVDINGRRATPGASIEYTADGSTIAFALPVGAGYELDKVANNDVAVYVDNVPLVYSVDFELGPVVGASRSVVLAVPPTSGSQVLMSVRTAAQYFVSGNAVVFAALSGVVPIVGDIVSITSFNDTSEQNIITKVFVGPVQRGDFVTQGYDSTTFDEGLGGAGAEFTVVVDNDNYSTVTVTAPGNGYSEKFNIRITGNLLGGTSPANDLLFEISGVNSNGGITNVTNLVGTSIAGTQTFDNVSGLLLPPGRDAEFTVTTGNGAYTTVVIAAGGQDYRVADRISIPGNNLGGDAETNVLLLEISAVSPSGAVTGVIILSGVAEPGVATYTDVSGVNIFAPGSGSFDFGTGVVLQENRYDLGRTVTRPDKIFVSLDGRYLAINQDYTITGSELVINGPILSSAATVVVTLFTEVTVPQSRNGFRIFQDMRGVQTSYRISTDQSTQLAQELLFDDDVIHVVDASKLAIPSQGSGHFGQITVNGERITYRTINLGTNTISGLRRGVFGTGAADHLTGSAVYDIGFTEKLPEEAQDNLVTNNTLADGAQTVFVTDIELPGLTGAFLDRAVEVYIGGLLQTSGYTVESGTPVTVEFAVPPVSGYQVSVRVLVGKSWYEAGQTLQTSDTQAARFIFSE
jgi:hypothetical protein